MQALASAIVDVLLEAARVSVDSAVSPTMSPRVLAETYLRASADFFDRHRSEMIDRTAGQGGVMLAPTDLADERLIDPLSEFRRQMLLRGDDSPSVDKLVGALRGLEKSTVLALLRNPYLDLRAHAESALAAFSPLALEPLE
jgi:hypothetical protein